VVNVVMPGARPDHELFIPSLPPAELHFERWQPEQTSAAEHIKLGFPISSEAKAIECSIQLYGGKLRLSKEIGRLYEGFAAFRFRFEKLWELTFALSSLAYSGGGPGGAKLYLGIDRDARGRSQQTVRTMDLRASLCTIVRSPFDLAR
jgi:hypothetical protein